MREFAGILAVILIAALFNTYVHRKEREAAFRDGQVSALCEVALRLTANEPDPSGVLEKCRRLGVKPISTTSGGGDG